MNAIKLKSTFLRLVSVLLFSCNFLQITGAEEDCGDNIDNDHDGLIDQYDPDCAIYNPLIALESHECSAAKRPLSDFGIQLDYASDAGNIPPFVNPYVGDLDGDGIPEIVTLSANSGINSFADILILDGRNGKLITKIKTDYVIGWGGTVPIAIGDVDGDGLGEIITASVFTGNEPTNQQVLYAYNHDGSLLWKSNLPYRNTNDPNRDQYNIPNLILTDFNNDGIVEALAYNAIFNAESGKLLVIGDNDDPVGNSVADKGFPTTQSLPWDMDEDGDLELVTGVMIYQVEIVNTTGKEGNSLTTWKSPKGLSYKDGIAVIADLNQDGYPEIISRAIDTENLFVWDPRNEEVLFNKKIGGGKYFGHPFVGNLDEDCNVEFGFSVKNKVLVYEFDSLTGNIFLDRTLITTDKSGRTGISLFDLNGDQIDEVFYRDDSNFRIIDFSRSSPENILEKPCKSPTSVERPIIADVNGDGEAEVVITCGSGFHGGELRVYGSAPGKAPWPATRPVWNQYAYYVTHVNEDLSIPAFQQNNAVIYSKEKDCGNGCQVNQPLNGFSFQPGQFNEFGCNQVVTLPDITVSTNGFCGNQIILKLENVGSGAHSREIPIAVYDGDPFTETPNLLKVVSNNKLITPGTNELLYVDLTSLEKKDLYILVNSDGDEKLPINPTNFTPNSAIQECNYLNNRVHIPSFTPRPLTIPNCPAMIINDGGSNCNKHIQVPDLVSGLNTDFACTGLAELKNITQTPAPGVTLIGPLTTNIQIIATDSLGYSASCYVPFQITCTGKEICNDGIDNDLDGLIDQYDPDCASHNKLLSVDPACSGPLRDLDAFGIQRAYAAADPGSISPQVTPYVADLDADGIPEIVTLSDASSAPPIGKNILVLDGRNGKQKTKILTDYYISLGGTIPIALGDVDKDGFGEIITASTFTGNSATNQQYLYAYNHDGSLLWKSDFPYRLSYSSRAKCNAPNLVLADFNNDGIAEVLAFNAIYNAMTGKLLMIGKADDPVGDSVLDGCFPTTQSLPWDTDRDGDLELVTGVMIYQVNISNISGRNGNSLVPWKKPEGVSYTDGMAVVADLNQDGYGEIISKGYNSKNLFVWDSQSGELLFNESINDNYLGLPFVGNIDSDCNVEFGFSIRNTVKIYEYDINTKRIVLDQTFYTSDSSGRTGISLFDLNGDGINEVFYRDTTDFRILDFSGATPSDLLTTIPCTSPSSMDRPIIADVDGDGEVEVMVTCGYGFGEEDGKIHVFERDPSKAPWPYARKLWNQHAYYVTHINDDLSIPSFQQNPGAIYSSGEDCEYGCTARQPLNGFSLQPTVYNEKGCNVKTAWADIRVTTKSFCGDNHIVLALENVGSGSYAKNLPIAIYNGDPFTSIPRLLMVASNSSALATGETELVKLDIGAFSNEELYILANHAGTETLPINITEYVPDSIMEECNYSNNLTQVPPFKICPLTITNCPGPIDANQNIQYIQVPDLTIGIKGAYSCRGEALITNVTQFPAAGAILMGPLNTNIQLIAYDDCGNSATCNVPYKIQSSKLFISKLRDIDYPIVGGTITFSVTVSNAGPGIATNIAFRDTIPEGLTYQESTITGAGADETKAPTLSWNIPMLASNEIEVMTYKTTVGPETEGKSISNVVAMNCADCVIILAATNQITIQNDPVNIGDRVWEDLNKNGIQDDGEPGINDVNIYLYDTNGTRIATNATDSNGAYLFTNVAPGSYQIEFMKPTAFFASPQDVGSEVFDSDANPTNGITPLIPFSDPGQSYLTIDAGFYRNFRTTATDTNVSPVTNTNQANPSSTNDVPNVIGEESNDDTNNPYEPPRYNDNDGSEISGQPLLAVLKNMQAYEIDGQVFLEWVTLSEVGALAYDVERKIDEDTYEMLNESAIPAFIGTGRGGTYQLPDLNLKYGQTNIYRIREHNIKGKVRYYGPYEVTVSDETPEQNLTEQTFRNVTFRSIPHPLNPSEYNRLVERGREWQEEMEFKALLTGNQMMLDTSESGIYFIFAEDIAENLDASVELVKRLLGTGELELNGPRGSTSYLADQEGEGLYFYAEKYEDNYTAENTYILSTGLNQTMESSEGQNPIPSAGGVFRYTMDVEENLFLQEDIFFDENDDYWLWHVLISEAGYPASVELNLPSPAPASGGNTAELSLRVKGGNLGVNQQGKLIPNEHSIEILLNETSLGSMSITGLQSATVKMDVQPSLLLDGTNKVMVILRSDNGAFLSRLFIDGCSLSYDRYFMAQNDMLTFSTEGEDVITIEGFNSPDIMIMDITNPQRPSWLDGITVDQNGYSWRASFICSADQKDYFACSGNALKTVEAQATIYNTALQNPRTRANYVILTTFGFMDTAKRLADYRATKGLETMVVNVDDIYDVFNQGRQSPYAIQNFLKYAYLNWDLPPEYVVLIGNGSKYFKDNLSVHDMIVPTIMQGTPNGLFGSDASMGDIDGDSIPEIAIGRLPVLSNKELSLLVNKIIAYEASSGEDWADKYILAADNPDEGGNFYEDNLSLLDVLSSHGTVDVLQQEMPSNGTQQIESADLMGYIDEGRSFINYMGHGSWQHLGNSLLEYNQVNDLRNGKKMPVILAMSCTVGRYTELAGECLANKLLLHPQGGAIAVWSPSGVAEQFPSNEFNWEFLIVRYEEGERILGKALLKTLERFAAYQYDPFLPLIYNLIGDPALEVK